MKFFLILLIFPFHGLAQIDTSNNGVSFGINSCLNKTLIHTPKVYFEETSNPFAIELSYKKQTLGNKDWHQKFGFPEVSLNLTYANYDFSYFGKAVGFYPAIQFRIFSIRNNFSFFKIGGGLGLISKKWVRKPVLDSFDRFIGSTLNNFSMFQWGYHFNISKKWSAQAGINYFHVSNAATRQPNFGINSTGLFFGINYHPKNVVTAIKKRELLKKKNPLNLNVHSSIGFSEARAYNGPLFPVYSYSLASLKMYRNKNRVGFGLSANFNTKTQSSFINNYSSNVNYWNSTWQFSLLLSNEFLFGRVGFPLTLGYNLNHPLQRTRFYQKLGMNWHFYVNERNIIKDSYLSLILKTHTSRAQYAEIGFGLLF